MLNTNKVSYVHYWWDHESFSDKIYREAAESIAFKVLNPSLRSRGKVSKDSKEILKDKSSIRHEPFVQW